eukprot:3498468-Rhodomonas_salina.1
MGIARYGMGIARYGMGIAGAEGGRTVGLALHDVAQRGGEVLCAHHPLSLSTARRVALWHSSVPHDA